LLISGTKLLSLNNYYKETPEIFIDSGITLNIANALNNPEIGFLAREGCSLINFAQLKCFDKIVRNSSIYVPC